jgi:hypothetical protein
MLVRKSEWKTPLGIPSLRWEDDIKIYLKKIDWEDVDLIHFALNRNHCENL